jgi:hypothetical protein
MRAGQAAIFGAEAGEFTRGMHPMRFLVGVLAIKI